MIVGVSRLTLPRLDIDEDAVGRAGTAPVGATGVGKPKVVGASSAAELSPDGGGVMPPATANGGGIPIDVGVSSVATSRGTPVGHEGMVRLADEVMRPLLLPHIAQAGSDSGDS